MAVSLIKAIVFDLGGVYFEDGTAKAMKKFEKILNLQVEKLSEVFGEQGYGRDYRLGKISESEFWEAARESLNLDPGMIKRLKEIWHSSYTQNKSMKTLVRELRKDYKVAVLSNNIKERVQYLNRKYNLNKEFDDYVYSFKYGFMKPDSKLFRILFQKLQIEQDEVVIIDNSAINIETFRRLGFKTILFQSVKQLKRELSNLLQDEAC